MDLNPNTKEYESYLIKLASENIARGVIEEPRLYYEALSIDTSEGNPIPVFADANTFVNGEDFPVRITHMVTSTRVTDFDRETGALTPAEDTIQQVGMQLRFHDQFYMNETFVPIPCWGTQVNASSDVINPGTSSLRPWRPFVLSVRDALVVTLRALVLTETGAIPAAVTITGVGLLSKRPYLFSGTVLLSTLAQTTIPPENFKNDGAEPVLITDITVNAAAGVDDTTAIGDLRNIEMGVRQIGNGTNADWVVSAPSQPNLCLGSLWGTYSGRGLVHQFPGNGLLWEPGEGILVSASALPYTSEVLTNVGIALVGYIAIQ
jgi:hypothetical protein